MEHRRSLFFALFVLLVALLAVQTRMPVTAVAAPSAATFPQTTVQLLQDINPILDPFDPTFTRTIGSWPRYFIAANNTLYFTAEDETHGSELWRSDGTAAGTYMVADIIPGRTSSNPFNPIVFSGFNNDSHIYFFAEKQINQNQTTTALWKSDGTAAGTVQPLSAEPVYEPGPFAVAGNKLFFAANDPTYGLELFAHSGVPNDYWLVADIAPGATGSGISSVDFVPLGNKILFAANDGTHGYELWVSDGTLSGTMMVKDINPSSTFNGILKGAGSQADIVVWGGLAYFVGNTNASGEDWQVWQTDGTPAATVQVSNLAISPTEIVILGHTNNYLFFVTRNPNQLWVSDGTTAGTTMLYDFDAQNISFNQINQDVVVYNNQLCFVPSSVSNEDYVFCSDGSTVHKIDVDPTNTPDHPGYFAVLNNVLYIGGSGLWQSDGTQAGTQRVPGTLMFKFTYSLHVVNDRLVFVGDDGLYGTEPWVLVQLPEQTFLPTVIR